MPTVHNTFSKRVLDLHCGQEVDRITGELRRIVRHEMHHHGAVVAVSGGVDSSVVAALCVEAFGKDRVHLLLMPERDSSPETLEHSRLISDRLEAATEFRDITDILEILGCYEGQDQAIRSVVPDYDPGWKFKIVLPSILDGLTYRLFSVVAQSPDGVEVKARLTPAAYLALVAATNFKQRTRKVLEYYYADKLNYAVVGTPNRLEYDQGFFVKLGDGAADVKPIAHLYKTQVYQLARYLDIPDAIVSRPPTTDTYSLAQTQEEFYFSVPYDIMDLCLYGLNHDVTAPAVAEATDLSAEQVESVYADIRQKRKATRRLHMQPVLLGDI